MKFGCSQNNNKNVVVLAIVTLLSIAVLIFSCINIAGTSGNHLTGVYLGEADIRHINISKILPAVSPIITILAKALTVKDVNTTQIFLAMEALGDSPILQPILELITQSTNTDKTIDALTTLAPLVASSNSSDSLADVISLVNNSNNSSMIFTTLSTLASSQDDSALEAIVPVMEIISNSNNVSATLSDLVVLSKAESYLPAAEMKSLLQLIEIGSANITSTLTQLSVLSTASQSLDITSEAALFVALEASYNKTAVLEGLITQTNSTTEIAAYTSLASLLSSSSNSTATMIDIATILLSSASQNATQLQYSQASLLSVASLLAYSKNATETMVLLPELVSATESNPAEATETLTSFISVLQTSKNSTLTLVLLSDLLASTSSTDSVTALIELLGASSNANSTLTNLVTVAKSAQTNASSITPLLSIMESSASSGNISDAYIYQNVMPNLMDNMNFATNYKLGVFSLCKYNTQGDLYYCTKSHAVQAFVMKDILYEELEKSSFSPYVKAIGLTRDDIIIKGELIKKQHLYVPGVRAILAFAILTIIAATVVPILYVTGLFSKVLTRVFTPLLVVNALLVGIISAAIGGLVKHGLKNDKYDVTWKIGAAMYALAWVGFFLTIVIAVCIYTTSCKTVSAETEVQAPAESEDQQKPAESSSAEDDEEIKKNDSKGLDSQV